MGYLLHRPIQAVSAIPTEESNGSTEFRPPTVDWLDPAMTLTKHGRRLLWDYTTIALAGTLTQTYRYPNTPRGSAAPDLRKAEELSLRACDNDMKRAISYGRKAWQRVDQYLDQSQYWKLVDVLAAALADVGSMSGYKVRQVLGGVDRSTAI